MTLNQCYVSCFIFMWYRNWGLFLSMRSQSYMTEFICTRAKNILSKILVAYPTYCMYCGFDCFVQLRDRKVLREWSLGRHGQISCPGVYRGGGRYSAVCADKVLVYHATVMTCKSLYICTNFFNTSNTGSLVSDISLLIWIISPFQGKDQGIMVMVASEVVQLNRI